MSEIKISEYITELMRNGGERDVLTRVNGTPYLRFDQITIERGMACFKLKGKVVMNCEQMPQLAAGDTVTFNMHDCLIPVRIE